MQGEITTERLSLRPLHLADAPRVAELTSDAAVARNVGMIPVPHPAICAEGWIAILKARASLRADHVYAVTAPDEDLIGCVGARARGDGIFEIGYWFGRAYWGRGYASEAAGAVAAGARALGALVAGHYEDNPASGRVLEKIGFAYTGEVQQRFSLARKEKVPTRMMAYFDAAA